MRPFSDGKSNSRYGDQSYIRLTVGKLTSQMRAKIQNERRKQGLPQVIDWKDFCEDAIAVPTSFGTLWCGSDDPRVEKFVKRREKMEEQPLQVARGQQEVDEIGKLEDHPNRAFFTTATNLRDPMSVAEGLYRLGRIKSTEVKYTATQIKYETRPPIVSIMGHVDHGKTTLLDTLRQTNIAACEAGGITQSIGAFQVRVPREGGESDELITFIDTPGHEAFAEMRKSGCSAADIIVLVISLSDGIQPQTREVISLAKSKNTPLVIAINKIDKGGDMDLIIRELSGLGVSLESEGGDVLLSKISAKHKTNVEHLLQNIQLQSLMCELYTPTQARAEITIIESKSKLVSGIVRCGTLRKGAWMVCGISFARVEKILDDRGREIDQARVSAPVAIEGFIVLPKPGNILLEVAGKHYANMFVALMRDVYGAEAQHEKYLQYLAADAQGKIYNRKPLNRVQSNSTVAFGLLIKAGTFGQLQALLKLIYALPRIDSVELIIINAEVDALDDDDITNLSARQQPGGFILFGDVENKTHMAIPSHLGFTKHDVVFHAVNWIKEQIVEHIPKDRADVVHMEAVCKSTFAASQAGRGGNAGGCFVEKGKLHVAAKNIRLIRRGETVWEGRIKELRRFKEKVSYVEEGLECGIVLDDGFAFEVGDRLQEYSIEWKEHDVDEIYQKAAAQEDEDRRLKEREQTDAVDEIDDESAELESLIHG